MWGAGHALRESWGTAQGGTGSTAALDPAPCAPCCRMHARRCRSCSTDSSDRHSWYAPPPPPPPLAAAAVAAAPPPLPEVAAAAPAAAASEVVPTSAGAIITPMAAALAPWSCSEPKPWARAARDTCRRCSSACHGHLASACLTCVEHVGQESGFGVCVDETKRGACRRCRLTGWRQAGQQAAQAGIRVA